MVESDLSSSDSSATSSSSSSEESNATSTQESVSSTMAVLSGRRNMDHKKHLQNTKRQKKKQKFLMFARVLMKYLEEKDCVMHLKAKVVIRDCAERNKRREKGFESVTSSMERRLQPIVGEAYWKRAEMYFERAMKKRLERQAALKEEEEKAEKEGKQQQQQQQQENRNESQPPPIQSPPIQSPPIQSPPPQHAITHPP